LQNYLFGLCAAAVFIVLGGATIRRKLTAAAALLPSLAALMFWLRSRTYVDDPSMKKQSLGFAFHTVLDRRLRDFTGGLSLASLARDVDGRAHAFLHQVLRGFTDGIDVTGTQAILWLIAAYVLAGCALGVARFGRGHSGRMKIAGLLVVLGGALAYLGLPHHLPELELMTFYPRFAVLVAALLLLLIPGWLRTERLLGAALVLLPALAVAGWYGWQLTGEYRRYGLEVKDFANVLDRTPPGGSALGMMYDRGSRVMATESAMVGLPSYYPVERRGPTSAVQIVYCGMRHMPCEVTSQIGQPPAGNPWAPQDVDKARAVLFFDYFFVRGGPPPTVIFGAQLSRVELLARSGPWAVYRRRH
jgi:hypothetical protein